MVEVSSTRSPSSTRSGSAQCGTSPGSSPRENTPEVIISLQHRGEEEVWETSDSDDDSTTSTPAYRRGELSRFQITEIIKKEGLEDHETKVGKRPQSVLILADSKLQDWPLNDGRCNVIVNEQWTINDWINGIRWNRVPIQVFNVVLYLERMRDWQSPPPPLKNALQSLGRAIRMVCSDTRIYVCSMLPNISNSPLSPMMKAPMFNPILMAATESVHRSMGCMYYLDIYSHFVSRQGGILSPSHKYFRVDSQLRYLGCLMFREFLFREAGFKKYWFLDDSDFEEDEEGNK